MILTMIKINTDLERMGDLAVNIAYVGKNYFHVLLDLQLNELSLMADKVRRMIMGSLDALVKKDVKLAQGILLQDDAVDDLKRNITEAFVEFMVQHNDMNSIQQGVSMIMVAKTLERIADHTTNISESVIFAFTGQDVRHHNIREKTDEEA